MEHYFIQFVFILINTISLNSVQIGIINEEESEKSICFPDLGCFSLTYPWDTIGGHIPQDPWRMEVKYFLSNRNLKEKKEIGFKNLKLLDNFKNLVFIVHGFTATAHDPWVTRLEEAILFNDDVNVISVDWQKAATGPNYFQALANIRIVARLISNLLNQIQSYNQALLDEIHLIGQSLGAHLVSFVKIKGRNISYITGLDPAQPWFANKPLEIRLDKTDADFVMIVHTNTRPFWPSLGLGIEEPTGDVDFYINGGLTQPGCLKNEKGVFSFFGNHLNSLISCSHMRAQEYLSEALESSCSFWGVLWNTSEKFPLPNEVECTLENCQEMGKFTKLLPARGTFFIKTNNFPPYCGQFFPTGKDIFEYIFGQFFLY